MAEVCLTGNLNQQINMGWATLRFARLSGHRIVEFPDSYPGLFQPAT